MLVLTLPAAMADNGSIEACQTRIAAEWPRWRFPAIDPEVLEWAEADGQNPTVAEGDFNRDGAMDVALLIEAQPDRKRVIAVCLTGADRLHRIEPLGCQDGIVAMRRGQRYYDFEADTEGVYDRDGVHAYCFGKAGLTYLLRDGRFHAVHDSD